MCAESQYCAYRHVSAMLERAHVDCWLAMFELEAYFDDSGTDGGSPVAVAACYVAKKSQWDEFVRNWDEARAEQGFDVFHMSEFVAPREHGHKPWCDWDNDKKDRVYRWLATIINTRVRKGFCIAVPKKPFDEYAIKEFKEQYAQNHYIFAAKSAIGLIQQWRQKFHVAVPMQYVFDRGSLGQHQLQAVWHECLKYPESESKYGVVPNGVMFQDKSVFKPLQAADILAWQAQSHMRKTVMCGRDPNDERYVHKGWAQLRAKGKLDIGFYSTEQVHKVFAATQEFFDKHGKWPWEPHPFTGRFQITDPGTVDVGRKPKSH